MASTKTKVVMAAAGVSGALLLSACGNGTPPAASSPPATSSSASETSPASSATSAPASSSGESESPAPPAGNGLCKAADVTLSLGKGDAGAGSTYRPLLIKNSSGKTCTIQGYPGVSYVGGSGGDQVGEDAVRVGGKGPVIKLEPGQSAAADIQFAQVNNFDPSACQPTDVKGLRIYLPQETAAKFVEDPGTGCAGKQVPGHQLSVKTVHRA
ncbi:DUF4232 domain-containing protein [Amycolatopsis jiangsuensis]|uniref:DUF4232 domain-containing protein n=1 Tax=Amycolatopsis jiangsuensis TaxID=1181879 RepID=A0A840J1F9_9PSEU|nr:DUF4232 domain-containing protein [Amycolatopsis jiangsuensis]MBB4687044.1 hypothetical protein [Amycolatopsis jiangsuensis]